MTNVPLANGLTSIGVSALSGRTSLTSVTLANSSGSIGDAAFSGCSSLANATITNGSIYFCDSQWTDYTRRYYRLRSP